MAVLSFMKGKTSVAGEQGEQMAAEARELGIDCPLGLDPDASGRSIFRDFGVTVGSATLVILDRSGNYAWFQQDPWQRDERFSPAILERIMKKN